MGQHLPSSSLSRLIYPNLSDLFSSFIPLPFDLMSRCIASNGNRKKKKVGKKKAMNFQPLCAITIFFFFWER